MEYRSIDGKSYVIFETPVGEAMYKSAHYLALLETAGEINPSQATEEKYDRWLEENFPDDFYYDDYEDEEADET